MDKTIKGQYMFNTILLYNDDYESYISTNENSKIQKVTKVKGFSTMRRLNNIPIVSTFIHLISYFIYFFKTFGFSMEHLNREIKTDIKKNNGDSKIIDISKKFDVYLTDIILIFSGLLGLAVSIVLFGLFPWLLFKLIIYYTNAYFVGNISVALYKILLLFLLIYLSSKIKEIKKIYMYHAAKHKMDKCIKNDIEISYENIKKQKYSIEDCKSLLIFTTYIYSTILFSITELYMIEIQGIFKLLITITLYLILSYIKSKYFKTKTYKLIIFPAKLFSQCILKEPNDETIQATLISYNSLMSAYKNNN